MLGLGGLTPHGKKVCLGDKNIMRKKRNHEVWAGIVTIIMILPVVTVCVNADEPFKPIIPDSPRFIHNGGKAIVFGAWNCVLQWQNVWKRDGITGGEGNRIATDGSNAYVAGVDCYGDGVILKYSTTGDLLWDVTPESLSQPEDLAEYVGYHPLSGKGCEPENFTQEQHEISSRIMNMSSLWDVCYDNIRHEIISAGQAQVLGIPVLLIIKRDAETGQKIWDKVYSFIGTGYEGKPIAGGVSVDENGDIFVAGGIYTSVDVMGVEWVTSIIGLNLNLGPNGIRHWVTIDDRLSEGGWVVYSGNGFISERLFTAGYKFIPTTWRYSFLASELNRNTGDTFNNIERNNDMFCVHMITDENAIYAVGGFGMKEMGALLKLTPSLELVYEKTIRNDFFQDIAVKGDMLALCGMVVQFNYTISLVNKSSGEKITRMKVGQVSYFCGPYPNTGSGLVVDNDGNFLLSGGSGAIDTLKCTISYITGIPGSEMEHN